LIISSITKCHPRTSSLNKILHRKNMIEENNLYIKLVLFLITYIFYCSFFLDLITKKIKHELHR
jgi:hypothetical protein